MTNLFSKIIVLLLFGTAPFSIAEAQELDFLPERPVNMVSDFADMLSSQEEARLNQKLNNYRDTTTNVLAIATIESLRGVSIEEAATELFSSWRMWEGERYNGVLLLISESDRRIRIEVGYGLEGAIPDVMANRIINDILQPNFRNGEVYQGLDRATDAMMQLASGEFEGTPDYLSDRGEGGGVPLDVIIIILVIIIFIITKGGRGGGRRRRTLGPVDVLLWGMFMGGSNRNSAGGGFGSSSSGGGGFGGFSGGGGFGSGGGGASGGW